MSRRMFAVVGFALLAAACGPESISQDGRETVGVEEQALWTDPWQNIFAARRSGASFIFNPVGTMTLTCPDGVVRTECAVPRINFGPSGLSATRQTMLRDRIAVEPANESLVSVLVKGIFVNVRDNRTDPPTSYLEFRVYAAYTAPTVRTHASSMLYVTSAVQDGLQAARSINSDLLPRGVSIPYAVRFRWVGPATERPSSYPADSLVSVAAYRLLEGQSNGGLGWGPYEMDADQLFRRVSN